MQTASSGVQRAGLVLPMQTDRSSAGLLNSSLHMSSALQEGYQSAECLHQSAAVQHAAYHQQHVHATLHQKYVHAV